MVSLPLFAGPALLWVTFTENWPAVPGMSDGFTPLSKVKSASILGSDRLDLHHWLYRAARCQQANRFSQVLILRTRCHCGCLQQMRFWPAHILGIYNYRRRRPAAPRQSLAQCVQCQSHSQLTGNGQHLRMVFSWPAKTVKKAWQSSSGNAGKTGLNTLDCCSV